MDYCKVVILLAFRFVSQILVLSFRYVHVTFLVLQLFVWPTNNHKVFGRVPAGEMIRDAIKVFNSPPSIAEK